MAFTNANPGAGNAGAHEAFVDAIDARESSRPATLKQARRATRGEIDDVIRLNWRSDSPLAAALRAAPRKRGRR